MLKKFKSMRKKRTILIFLIVIFLYSYFFLSACRPWWLIETTPDAPDYTPETSPTPAPTPPPSTLPAKYRGRSSSAGRPNNGSLKNGVLLKPRRGIRLNDPDRTWGTEETVSLMNMAIDKMLEKYPKTCDMFIGDISRKGGGKLRPHISHQSGRDIDVSLYAKGNRFIYFENMNSKNLDLEKTWYFIETLLVTERVQMILLDYEVQKLFYRYLKPFYSKRKLEKYLQYPRPKNVRKGIIRHAHSHQNHLHIRFKCSDYDAGCKNW